jgi:hypothetical protein
MTTAISSRTTSIPTASAARSKSRAGTSRSISLAKIAAWRQPTISKHLRILEDAGFIRQARDAQRRPRSLVVGGPLEAVDGWLKPFREQWEKRFDRLDSFLAKKSKRTNKGEK